MFTEEIEIMKLLSEKYSDDIRIFFKSPKSIDEIISFEEETGIRLPDDLRELYKLTNGFDSNIAYMNLWSLETVKNISMRDIIIGSRRVTVINTSC